MVHHCHSLGQRTLGGKRWRLGTLPNVQRPSQCPNQSILIRSHKGILSSWKRWPNPIMHVTQQPSRQEALARKPHRHLYLPIKVTNQKHWNRCAKSISKPTHGQIIRCSLIATLAVQKHQLQRIRQSKRNMFTPIRPVLHNS